jgi:calpain-15
VNDLGLYRVNFCKNGEWQVVTIDDLIPCYPQGPPLFSQGRANELWVSLIEKAYAKMHGSYYSLRNGFINEALIDLTGAPTSCYNLGDEFVQQFIQSG